MRFALIEHHKNNRNDFAFENISILAKETLNKSRLFLEMNNFNKNKNLIN